MRDVAGVCRVWRRVAADFSVDSGHDLWRVVHRAGGLRQEIARHAEPRGKLCNPEKCHENPGVEK